MRLFGHEDRKAFYKKELETGVIFEKNRELFMKSEASPELLQKLKDADFPQNAVTVLGNHTLSLILLTSNLKVSLNQEVI